MSDADVVHVLMIDHRHGTNTYVCTTEEVAQQQLVSYVDEWWGQEGPGQTRPTDDEEAVEQYFDHKSDEDWRIEEATVIGETT